MATYAVVTLLVVVAGLAIVTLSGLLISKAVRDRHERRAEAALTIGRLALNDQLTPAQHATLRALLLKGAYGSDRRQGDLVAVYRAWDQAGVTADPDSVERVGRGAAATVQHVIIHQLLHRDPVRRGLATAIGGSPVTPLPVPVLTDMLHDDDYDVRLTAARSLERAGTADAAYALIDALRNGLLPPERLTERLRYTWALPAVLAEMTAPEPPDATVDAKPWLARACGMIGDKTATGPLLRLLLDPSTERRVNAARGLAGCAEAGDPAVVSAARRACRDVDEDVRAHGYAVLARVGGPRDVPLMLSGLRDSGWHVRARAADALLSVGVEGVMALEAAVDDDDPYAADRASETLAGITLTKARS